MKQQSKLLLALLHGAGVGTLIPASVFFVQDAIAGISNTKHNLSNTISGQNRTTATGEVCVFCHTPHAADLVTNAPPLWNKRLTTGATYTTYAQLNTATLDADNTYGTTSTGSASLACLSCHDGTQALDNIINAPGSGGYSSDGGGASGLSWTWANGNNERTDSDGKLVTGAITNLTPDLRNDHPIGIAYCGGTSSGSYSSGTTTGCRDGDFRAITLGGGTAGGSDAQWYVETNFGTGRDKSDIILYTRAISTANVPTVECGSCHDPHVETKATNQVAFLRVSQANSGLCLSCHNK